MVNAPLITLGLSVSGASGLLMIPRCSSCAVPTVDAYSGVHFG